MSPIKAFGLGLLSLIFMGGCATLPKDFEAQRSYAVAQSETTTLGNMIKPEISAHPGLSGFHVLNNGRQAFNSRTALADTAEKTIDCQYFIWAGDASGIILLDRLVKAADRGVRVRLLFDDMTSHGKDLGLAALNHHKNIEIRIFNPLGRRYYFGVFRMMSLALHAGRMTNRMHNKIFAVDNQVGIIGGRNIADEYFGIDKRSNFRDLDLLAVGPIVSEISNAFDSYWNSPWAVPFEVFKTRLPSDKKALKKKEKLVKNFKKMEARFPYPLDWSEETRLRLINERKAELIWAEAQVVSDPPGKAWEKAHRGTSNSQVVRQLSELVQDAKKEVLVVSPYFIIPQEHVEKMGDVVRSGVALKLFTNSLRSTDAVPVVAMYRKLRKPMLRQGVQIYEMRPDAESHKEFNDASVQKARMSLHMKAVVFDRKKVFVGTFNIDPRSEYLNTEVGLLVNSVPLAEKVAALIDNDLSPVNAYSVGFDQKGKSVRWTSEEKGEIRQYSSDPRAGWWLDFKAGFLALLPISSQL